MTEIESMQHSNIAEEEMGQLHGIHYALNAIAAIQRSMPAGESRVDCVDCGMKIPEARRLASPGCSLCIHCKTVSERAFRR